MKLTLVPGLVAMIEKSLTQPTHVDEDQREITANLIPLLRKTVFEGLI